MSGHGFASALAGDLDAYLAFKTDMGGRDTAARACYLRKFDIWCTEHGRAVADQDTVRGLGSRSAGKLRPFPGVDVLHP